MIKQTTLNSITVYSASHALVDAIRQFFITSLLANAAPFLVVMLVFWI